eukprot:Nk52_evm1s1176 gene=Nk52_evmTU1s1176
MKPERYGNTEDVHQYTVKYLIDGTVYSGVHYRRILKVNPVSVPTFPSLTANLNGIDCGGLKIHSHRYYEGTGAEYQVYDPDDNTYQQWLSSHQVDPSLIVTYWEEYYANAQERGQNDMPESWTQDGPVWRDGSESGSVTSGYRGNCYYGNIDVEYLVREQHNSREE